MMNTLLSTPTPTPAAARRRPSLRLHRSVSLVPTIRLAALATGSVLLATAAHLHTGSRAQLITLTAGFRPPGIRQLMSNPPTWSALTHKDSMRSAYRWAEPAMFAAGERSTTIISIAAVAYASHAGIPGGHGLLIGAVIWAIAATIAVSTGPKGDCTKALRALGWRKLALKPTRHANNEPPDRSDEDPAATRSATPPSVAAPSTSSPSLRGSTTGAWFPRFLFITVPAAHGVHGCAPRGVARSRCDD